MILDNQSLQKKIIGQDCHKTNKNMVFFMLLFNFSCCLPGSNLAINFWPTSVKAIFLKCCQNCNISNAAIIMHSYDHSSSKPRSRGKKHCISFLIKITDLISQFYSNITDKFIAVNSEIFMYYHDHTS